MRDEILPASFGRYRPIKILGEGAAGRVYLAEDPVLDRQVTVKIIRTAGMDEPTYRDFLERFKVEARAAGRCTHAGIVAIYDYAESDGTPFIVMEYVDGPSLLRALHDPALRAELDPIAITLQILDALDAAHRLNITHRDIKPANILLTRERRVKIADFGIARLDRVVMTQYTAMVGTPSYMAPEQAGSRTVDHRADLFATGALLYEMLTGKPPFHGSTMQETLASLLGPVPASTAMLPPMLAPVLAHALAKVPELRFQSAAEFATALRATATESPLAADGTFVAPPLPGHRPESLSNATAAEFWGVAYLKALEKVLARHVGPIAALLIRNAAARTTDAPTLHGALAAAIDKPVARAEFLREVGLLRPPTQSVQQGTALPAESVVAVAPQKPPTLTPLTLTPEALLAAESALAQHIGPIAKLLVRQAAQRSGSLEEFRDRLATNLTRPDEASIFRRRLDKALIRP